jgi:hypothetical protein
MARQRAFLAAGMLVLTVACGGSGTTGAGSDAGVTGGFGGTGGTGAVGGAIGDGGIDAPETGGDAALPLDPAKACDLSLTPSALGCKQATATAQPILGGVFPEGVLDRELITGPFPAATCDARSTLFLRQGVFQLRFDALGGPFISGGSYTVDSSVGRLIFTTTCGDNNVGYFYEWNASTQRLTLFPDDFTGWVYTLRP